MKRFSLCASLAAALLMAAAAYAAAPHRIGWSAGVGPQVHFLSERGHTALTNGIIQRRGVGGEGFLGYGFTKHWAGRISVGTAKQSSWRGDAGLAWGGVDLIFRLPVRNADVVMFGRFGRLALALDGTALDELDAPTEHTWVGPLAGVGGGARYWLNAHITVNGDVSVAVIRYTDSVSPDGTGTPTRLSRKETGTMWSIAFALEYHW